MINVDKVLKIGKVVVGIGSIIIPAAQKFISDREMKKQINEQFADVISDIVNTEVKKAMANREAQ